MTHRLDALLAPASVAIVGASSDPRRFGGRPIQYLRQAPFAGPVYPVNPGRDVIQGLPAYACLADVPGPVDCALIAVATADTLEAVQACADHGVRSAILFGNGFAEMGAEGLALQDRMVAIARGAGMRLLGPNCMGLVNPHARFYATFASALEEGLPPPGRIGLASQSGGYGGYVMKHMFLRRLGLGTWVTTGNECDVMLGEVVHWLAQDDATDVILMYLEGLRADDDLLAGLRLARQRGKPVIAMKVGRTAEGSAAAVSHTAALTGADKVYDAVFEEFGVHRARSTEELLDLAYAFGKGRHPAGRRVGVVSISGGIGVQIADYASDAGLVMGPVPAPTQAALRALVPNCSPRNPIDMTGLVTANHDLMERTMDAVLAADAFDMVVVFIGISGAAPSQALPLTQAIRAAAQRHPGRMICVCVTAPQDIREMFERAGFLVMEDPARAIATLAALARFAERRAQPSEPAVHVVPTAVDLPAWTPGQALSEVQAKQVLQAAGIAVPQEAVARDAAQAARLAGEIGFPVAVKVVSPDLPHKSEHGGVALGLRDAGAVAAAVEAMQQRIAQAVPQARIEGFLVSQMVTGGVEMLVGVHRDPNFGPIVTVGAGGVQAEWLQDTACHRAPVSARQAQALIASLRSAQLLRGWRGLPAADMPALAAAVAGLSALVCTHAQRFEAVEVNPLVVRDAGQGVVALDAVVQLRKP